VVAGGLGGGQRLLRLVDRRVGGAEPAVEGRGGLGAVVQELGQGAFGLGQLAVAGLDGGVGLPAGGVVDRSGVDLDGGDVVGQGVDLNPSP